MVLDVHAAKMATRVAAVDDLAVGQDVSEGAFLAKLAIALSRVSRCLEAGMFCFCTFVKYLQGARSVSGSSECRKGHERPAWHAPCR